MTIVGIIVGLLILILLVVVHELGHGIVARRNGVIVEEFGVGFPPRAFGRKIKKSILGKNVLFSINWLPLGGFVKLKGEHDADEKPGDFGAASFWAKTKIMFAGVIMNWLVAALLLTILAWTGLPQILPHQFSLPADRTIIKQPVQLVTVEAGSPAQKAGLKPGDQINKINQTAIKTPQQLSATTKKLASQTVHIFYTRGGKTHEVTTKLNPADDAKKGILGVAPAQQEVLKTTWSAPIVGVVTTAQLSWATVVGVWTTLCNAFSGAVMNLSPDAVTRHEGGQNLDAAKNNLAGPVSIVGVIFPAAEKAGPTQLTLLTAIISLTLAVMNVLPIPALDGGTWYVMAIFRLFRKKLTETIQERIQMVGFSLLMLLVIVVTIGDIGRVF